MKSIILTIRNKVSKQNPAGSKYRNKTQNKANEKPHSCTSGAHASIGVCITPHLGVGHNVNPVM